METLNLIKNDPWLEPFADAINGRHLHAIDKESGQDHQFIHDLFKNIPV